MIPALLDSPRWDDWPEDGTPSMGPSLTRDELQRKLARSRTMHGGVDRTEVE
jgi:hypothetical protein